MEVTWVPVAEVIREEWRKYELIREFAIAAVGSGKFYGGQAVARAEEAYSALLKLYPLEDKVSDRVEVQRRAGRRPQTDEERSANKMAKEWKSRRVFPGDIIGVYK